MNYLGGKFMITTYSPKNCRPSPRKKSKASYIASSRKSGRVMMNIAEHDNLYKRSEESIKQYQSGNFESFDNIEDLIKSWK